MYFTLFGSPFLIFFSRFSWNYTSGSNFSAEAILQNDWIILGHPHILYFNISIWRTQIVCHWWYFNMFTWFRGVFHSFSKFPQICEGGTNILGWTNAALFGHSLLHFSLRNLKGPNSASLIRFQCIIHDSAVFLISSN